MNDKFERNLCNRESSVRPETQSRRSFLQRSTTAAASLLGGLSLSRAAHAQGSDQFKIALIGCGGRGTGAAIQALNTKADVQLVAMADALSPRKWPPFSPLLTDGGEIVNPVSCFA